MFTIFHIEFFNYGSCRAARIDSYESHSTGWVEESHFGLELDKNETDGVEPFALSPEFTAQSFKALLLPPMSLKKRPKKKRKEGRQPYWQNIRKWLWCGRLVSYACYFFPLTDKSIISPRSVPFHSSCIFISFTWILLFYKGASDWKERSYALATDLANMIRWFPSLWNLHQHSLLMEHSKDILIKTNPRN